ncbi:hypothetical protein KP509_29G042700 [Ceratopteris richardii]|uniref:Uncharacterized protein n=1 Tax=Ceratopteris richardii TaxID=49495 RepID=A0A8T2R8P1_CERRI|nr:hypothetical protein KP509_29G042700 [Ceratopteris richardii]KAH7291934.1 hypothetical protein KP509_29G042700 [Ceratopteris richardii]KAH7291935.1 hypothetical protein KP509_29G042700 [Ceratopteris richardii]
MNGSQLATRLFMVEQTQARYLKEQKRQYQNLITPTSKDTDVENSETSIEATHRSSSSNNYVIGGLGSLPFSLGDQPLGRCIFVPFLDALIEVNRNGNLPYLYLSNRTLEESEQSKSNLLALPPISGIGEASSVAEKSSIKEVHPSITPELSKQKNTKKKRKKKNKKSVKENAKPATQVGQSAKVEARNSGLNTSMKQTMRDAGSNSVNCVNVNNEVQIHMDDVNLVPSEKLNHLITMHTEDPKDHSLDELHDGSLSKAGDFSVYSSNKSLPHGSLPESNLVNDSGTLGGQEYLRQEEMLYAADHCNCEIDSDSIQGLFLDTCKQDDSKKTDSDLFKPTSNLNIRNNCCSDEHEESEQRLTDLSGSASACDSSSNSIPKRSVGMKRFKESLQSKLKSEASTTLNRQLVGDHLDNILNLQKERGETAYLHIRSAQPSFWTQRSEEGHDFPIHRTKLGQSSHVSASCDQRPSAPFWRHQIEGTSNSSYSWSKSRQSRGDDWSFSKRFPSPSSSRQPRNVTNWDQSQNLGQPVNGPHWKDRTPLDRQWSRGPSYSSFNMQQRKLGRSAKGSQKYTDKWPQTLPNNWIAPSMVISDVQPSVSNTGPVMKVESASKHVVTSKDFLKDRSTKLGQGSIESSDCSNVEALESAATGLTTTRTQNSHQNEQCSSDPGKFHCNLPKSQVAEHACGILKAVNASYESWGTYEQVSKLNGRPLCEFERVVRAVAPTFTASVSQQICKPTGCSFDCIFYGSEPSRQISDVQLSSVWQWYEEPSSYGLKVKLTQPSKRTGSSLLAFFVPYLSGIQLFGWSTKKKMIGNKDVGTAVKAESHDSGYLDQSILSILLPRPEMDSDLHTTQVLPKGAGTTYQRDSPECADEDATSIVGKQCHCDVQPLYEFFEVEKPQQRKPLAERIKELVSNSNVNDRAYLLNSAKIDDLHPSSWFAVAWYPIYKIPDESFRSAFLTYHCLSSLQLTCLRPTNTNHSMDSHMNTVIAPVVGLMSYNVQAKDWFSLPSASEATSNNVLEQYLSKLETAAATMARGSCENTPGFKHADFSFFQSRGR